MKDQIIEELYGKSILILGFGREGRSTYKFLKENRVPCKIGIADAKEIQDIEIIKDENVEIHTGSDYLDYMKEYDLVMKTPGVSFKDVDLTDLSSKIISQTELFLKYAGHKTIGVTGTKGKSTVSSLIFNMLSQKYNVILVGNIGLPSFDMIDSYNDTDWYVYELSSHQLEFVKSSPTVAVLLNMYEEHLDHYKSYEIYKEAKRNIFKYQDKTDWYIYNGKMADVINHNQICKQHTIGVDEIKSSESNYTVFDENKIIIKVQDSITTINIPENPNIKGKHNIYNTAVAATVATVLGTKDIDIVNGIISFKALPHRLECIGKYNDITFIDDSISTIPAATMCAIDSIKSVNTILIGGMDRGIDYTDLIKYLGKNLVANVILMYDSGKRIYEKLNKENLMCNVIYADNLEKAVELACQITTKGTACVLSPAAASYGIFKNFEERGEAFKELVKKYSK